MASRFLQALGERIRALRLESGLSQEDFAAAASLDRGYIGRVERGGQNIAVLTVAKIARALDKDPHELLNGLPSYDPESDDPEVRVPPQTSGRSRAGSTKK